MSEDALIRLANLKALGHGPTALVQLAGNTYPYWRDLLAGKKSFGEKAARKIEEKLGLPRGCLDTPEGTGRHGSRPPAAGGDRVSEPGVAYQPDIVVIIDRLQVILLECKPPALPEAADSLHRFALSPDSAIAKAALVDLLRRLTGRPAAGQPAQVAPDKQAALEAFSQGAVERHAKQRHTSAKG